MQSQIIIDRFLRSESSYQYSLHAYEKLILFFLASYMGKKSTCYPSFKSLALACNLSVASINVGRGIKAQGNKTALPRPRPLRTVRETFASYGSSLDKTTH